MPDKITQIPAPRVPIVDPQTGYINREWYRFLYNLYSIAGTGTSGISTVDLALAPVPQFTDAGGGTAPVIIEEVDIGPPFPPIPGEFEDKGPPPYVPPNSSVYTNDSPPPEPPTPPYEDKNPAPYVPPVPLPLPVPTLKTADFTVADNELWLINNKSGSTCTVTLPTASAWSGRTVTFQNYQAQLLISASADVVPQGGGTAQTGILLNIAGNWATLVSNGTNWVIMQAGEYNNLLLES